MKAPVLLKFSLLALACLAMHGLSPGQRNAVGGYNVYYGSLHNHSNLSDGNATGSPEEAYRYARETSQLDFFSLADHCYYLTGDEWTYLKQTADAANVDSSFTALHGFEWSSNDKYGHITIINTDTFTSVLDTAADTFIEISAWITRNNGIAFFNHPGREDYAGVEFDHFQDAPNSNFVGIELWNRWNGFDVYYENDGYFTGDTSKSFFDEALLRGWRTGASGSEDNHTANWGQSSCFRMAVLAKANTRRDIVEALVNRRFYSTLDKNLALSFEMDSAQMGDSTAGGDIHVTIEAFDGDGEQITTVELKRRGSLVATWVTDSTHALVRGEFSCKQGEYYYVKVTEADGDQAISSPIFIGKEDATDTVTVTDTTYVYDTIQVTGSPTGQDGHVQARVYPVPFTDELFIENNSGDEFSFSILDATMRRILISGKETSRLLRVKTDRLSRGFYVVSIRGKNGSGAFKIFK